MLHEAVLAPGGPVGAVAPAAPLLPYTRGVFGCPLRRDMMITLEEQIAEAQRALALRRKVYPQWIKRGKLDMTTAHYQLQAMEAIIKTLMRLDAEQRQLSLFTTHHEDPASWHDIETITKDDQRSSVTITPRAFRNRR